MNTPPVHRISIPNPYFEGANNAWLIAADVPTLIDTAIGTPAAWDALVAGLAAHGYAPSDIQQLILTHKHFDHTGLAWKLLEAAPQLKIYAHREDIDEIIHLDQRINRFTSAKTDQLRAWGVPEAELRTHAAYPIPSEWDMRPVHPLPIADNQSLDLGAGAQLNIIHTPGHTMGCLTLKLDRYLFVGDHVLPSLSPNIGGGDIDKPNLLTHYLASLDRIAPLQSQNLLVLPGHGAPFTRLAERCHSIAKHHHQRLDRIANMLTTHKPLTVYQIAHALFGEMKSIHLLLGCAEANAHLQYLQQQSRAQVTSDGRWRLH